MAALKTITYVTCQGPGVIQNREAAEGVRKSKRLVDNGRFGGLALIKIPRDQVVKPIDLGGAEKNVEGEHAREEDASGPQKFEEEDNEEEVESVPEEEYVPEEDEMKGVLKEKIFGGLLPKAVRKLKPPRKGLSER